MSYILEALRKADREREAARQRPADLAPETPAPARPRSFWPWLAAGALAVNASIALLLLLRPPVPVPGPANGVVVPAAGAAMEGGPAHPDAIDPPASPSTGSLTTGPAAPPGSAGVSPLAAPAAADPPARAARIEAPRLKPDVRTGVPGEAPRAPAGPESTQPGGASPVPGAGAMQAAVSPGAAPAGSASPSPPGRSTAAAARGPASPPTAAPSPSPAPSGQMRLDVHVFADQAADRFVFINGRKYVEGQLVDGRFQLVEITAEGAVLTSEGQRVFLGR